MAININATSPGERIVVALAILGLVAEMLSDNSCAPQAQPIDPDVCVEMCDPYPIKRLEAFACECAIDVKP